MQHLKEIIPKWLDKNCAEGSFFFFFCELVIILLIVVKENALSEVDACCT